MKKIVIFVLILLIIPIASAAAHMPLLAVKETAKGTEGSIADLYLDISPGTGRVFLETFPLTKFDTQISTRFAKDVACNYLDINCNKYDFFYTIRAKSPIVGGPSAGAAIAVLTATSLLNLDIAEDTVITGTINAGGLIGPVGGLREKIEAGATINITKILIPKGEQIQKIDNITLNLADYAESRNITTVEVGDLNNAIYLFTGRQIKKPKQILTADESYIKTMSHLAEILCNRSRKLEDQIDGYVNEFSDDDVPIFEKAENLTLKGKQAYKNKTYYSSASYCFGANVKYKYLKLKFGKRIDLSKVQHEIDEFQEYLDGLQIKTLTDLESYMVVKERLRDAQDNLNSAAELAEGENKTEMLEYLAYATERIYSAYSWAEFFGKPGRNFELDSQVLKEVCLSKLSEADERFQYAKIFFGKELKKTKKGLEQAHHDFDDGQYELCIFRASKTKADADTLLSLTGIEEDKLPVFLDSKLDIIKQNIIEEQEKGIFPILGYSYYEYANVLKEDDVFAALLYSEYALELSNLEMYFKPVYNNIVSPEKAGIELKHVLIFLFGAVFGFAAGYLVKIILKAINFRKN